MDTVFLFQNTDPGAKQPASEAIQENINPFPHELNITDGGEFLDDGLRMKDQPLEETEENEKVSDSAAGKL
jgi:hypothetical protein